MKLFFYNTKYFIKEVGLILFSNKASNLLSLLSTTLIFFVLSLVIGMWMITSDITDLLMDEAKVSAYMVSDITEAQKTDTMTALRAIEGVREIVDISADEAYERMEKVLGTDAKVLSYFDDNPFDGFLEVNISLEQTSDLISEIEKISTIESVRDNSEVLEKLSQLSELFNILSLVFLLAVGFTTIVIVSHIIRQGIYIYKDQMNTLNLLGAP
jgi:cell division transport system permease protein